MNTHAKWLWVDELKSVFFMVYIRNINISKAVADTAFLLYFFEHVSYGPRS